MTDGQQWGPPPPAGHGGPEQPASPDYHADAGHPQQSPHGQHPYGQAPYGHVSYGHVSYGQAAYGQAPYGQAPYGQAPYGQAPYGQAPYGQAGHAWTGSAPYGYGPPGAAPRGFGQQPVWPYGPGRPPVATTAAVFGIVTGALTALGGLLFLLVAAGGQGDAATTVLILGLPCAVGLITGGVQVLQRRSSAVLFWSAAAALGVLAVALVAGMTSLGEDDRIAVAGFVLFACILPVVTAVLVRLRTVTEWLAAHNY